MNSFIAMAATLIIVCAVCYLLVVNPAIIGAVVIIAGMMVIAWILIVAIYTGMLSLLERLDLAIHRRRRMRRRNGEGNK